MTALPTLLVALVLGLRHATDPDHLTAVSTLVFAEERHGPGKAGRLGLAWGLGHATTLLALGLPIVLLGFHLPQRVGQAAEALIGLLIVGLSVRLLWRWWRGRIHLHLHAHDGLAHAHMHVHDGGHAGDGGPVHRHLHADALGKTPLAAYGIGLVHGVGGSAAVGLLLVSSMATRGGAAAALLLFAFGTAVSMALISAAFAWALGRGPVLGHVRQILPAVGAASLLFGIWYGAAALGSLLSS